MRTTIRLKKLSQARQMDTLTNRIPSPQLSQSFVFPSSLGWMVLSTSGHEIKSLKIGYKTENAAIRKSPFALDDSPSSMENNWIEKLKLYALGERITFEDFHISLEGMTEFRKQVTLMCQSIPYGQTVTYGELARLAGSERAYRAVGSIMSKNPFPILVPCHRVLTAGKKIGGFSSPQGVSMKKKLLKLEGASIA